MVDYLKERWQPGEVVLAGGYTAWVGTYRYMPVI
jgi:hypothetical protein